MQVGTDTLNEPFVDIFMGRIHTGAFLLHQTHQICDCTIKFILGKQVWNFTRHEEIVEQLQEFFKLHIGICEQEGDLLILHTSQQVQPLDIFIQVLNVVCLRKSDLEGLSPLNTGG